jgi:hypothetical protein
MELTDENQDGMDCRPLGRETGIKIPEWLEDLIKARKEAMKAVKSHPETKDTPNETR